MINFNYNTNLYPCFSNYFGLKIYFLIPITMLLFQSLIWNGHMFFHIYIYTHFHVSHFCIYIIISVFVNYAVKKGYKLLNISFFVHV